MKRKRGEADARGVCFVRDLNLNSNLGRQGLGFSVGQLGVWVISLSLPLDSCSGPLQSSHETPKDS